MNVALELTRRKYSILKDVFHIIVQLFRPKAPNIPELQNWVKWGVIDNWDTLHWYQWRIHHHHTHTNQGMYIMFNIRNKRFYCFYCLCLLPDMIICCFDCNNALKKLLIKEA
mgnify:CR=1 FL=1